MYVAVYKHKRSPPPQNKTKKESRPLVAAIESKIVMSAFASNRVMVCVINDTTTHATTLDQTDVRDVMLEVFLLTSPLVRPAVVIYVENQNLIFLAHNRM